MPLKVLLYYPNWYNINWIPLGVSILYTRLKEKGIIVELFDTTFYNLIGSGNKSDRSMLRESDLQKGIKQGQYMESNFENFVTFDPVTFDKDCVSTIRKAADRLGYTHRDIISGAGHDACWINKVAPTAMVMCPCVDGLSHNEAEDISQDWAVAGSNVLFHAVLETAEIID